MSLEQKNDLINWWNEQSFAGKELFVCCLGHCDNHTFCLKDFGIMYRTWTFSQFLQQQE